jgi:hypothetical protein
MGLLWHKLAARSIDRAKIEADARFDGLFVLRTNTKISALQVVLRYRNLLAVEDAFKTAKALLATRPIFHKTDAGIRGHVFCTFLALVLRKELMDRLAARRSKLEWQRIIDDLRSVARSRSNRMAAAPGSGAKRVLIGGIEATALGAKSPSRAGSALRIRIGDVERTTNAL